MALVSLQEVSLGFGGPLLLENASLQIEPGDSVGVLGRNGMGKTTLLKLIHGELEPDRGRVARQQGLRVGYLPQEIPPGLEGTVAEIVADGLRKDLQLNLGFGRQAGLDDWQKQLLVDKAISMMELPAGARFEHLSAGLKRRALLARELAQEPDLLLLDEPTNHVDLAAIHWLEDFLARWGGTLVFVTHDRAFLQKLAKRIVELDRGRLFPWNGTYENFVKARQATLSAEADQQAVFDKKLAQEEQWIRRGVEARRRRNEGRVRALKRLRELRQERREQPGKVRLQVQEARRSGKLALEARDVSYSVGEKVIIKDFSTAIQRGDKVGIIGPNGSGKTTLLRLLIGELQPTQGEVREGTNIDLAYYDQLRAQLDENKTVLENVGQGSDTITISGRTRQVIGYLGDFLFPPERVHTPIGTLSGGERNRLMLARLFSRPANVLAMDEPTNDLDIETLELLEDLLLEYSGTLLLVTHDRELLNNVATTILALDGSGEVRETSGGYEDWLQAQKPSSISKETDGEARAAGKKGSASSPNGAPQTRKLSYNEQRAVEAEKRELAGLPEQIEALEAEQHLLVAAMSDPAFYQRSEAEITRDAERLRAIEAALAQAYARWEELESRYAGG
jgi:ABC transport system ATP-binding/permease protein